MKSPLLYLFGFVVMSIGYSDGYGDPLHTIVLDSTWGPEYAKRSCDDGDPCSEPIQAAREFETELSTQFGTEGACASIQFFRFNGPEDADKAIADAMLKEHWSLSLNFVRDSPKQQWQMLRSLGEPILLEGAGTPNEIAKEVCSIVNARGAKLQN